MLCSSRAAPPLWFAQSGAAASKELERLLKLHEDVLRALVIRLDKQSLEGLAQMRAVIAAAPPPFVPQA